MNEKLLKVQSKLKAPKNQVNKFGGYNYRNCEDIFEAVKPLLAEEGLTLVVSDELVMIGERYYIKATAKLSDGKTEITNTAYAREEETKKGMDGSQITGASSSYARKYALNGLFLIDDVKDSDSTNTHGKDKPKFEMVGDGETLEEIKKHQQLENVLSKLMKEKNVDYDKLIDLYKVDDLHLMTIKQYENAISNIDKFEKVA